MYRLDERNGIGCRRYYWQSCVREWQAPEKPHSRHKLWLPHKLSWISAGRVATMTTRWKRKDINLLHGTRQEAVLWASFEWILMNLSELLFTAQMAKLGTSSGFGIKVCNVVVPGHLKNLEASNVKSCVINSSLLVGLFCLRSSTHWGKKKKKFKKIKYSSTHRNFEK